MPQEKIPVNEKVLIELANGKKVGGFVFKVTTKSVRLSGAFYVVDERNSGQEESQLIRGTRLGNVEIQTTDITQWTKLPAGL